MILRENLVSAWALVIGIVIAITIGVFQVTLSAESSWIYLALAVLGIIIGIGITSDNAENSKTFLLATTCLVIVSSLGQSAVTLPGELETLITTILSALLTMLIPATVILAIKTVFSAASSR